MPDFDSPPARNASRRDNPTPDTAASAGPEFGPEVGPEAGHEAGPAAGSGTGLRAGLDREVDGREADGRIVSRSLGCDAGDLVGDSGGEPVGEPGGDPGADSNGGRVSEPAASAVGGSSGEPLMSGDLVPHFALIDVDGRRRRYADLWQQRLLALVLLPEAESGASVAYQDSLAEIAPALAAMNTALIVASGAVPGLAPPGWLVADQFGEIQHVQQSDDPREVTLPAPDEVVQWVRYVRTRCG